ncbi:hypothetical protein Tco_1073285, partial [Tanacetum coccineum]
VKKKITMAGPIMKEYISAISKSFISNNNNGIMIEKNFIENEGTLLLKIHDNAFHGNHGEDVFKHINSFLEVVEPLKIRGLILQSLRTWRRRGTDNSFEKLRFYHS